MEYRGRGSNAIGVAVQIAPGASTLHEFHAPILGFSFFVLVRGDRRQRAAAVGLEPVRPDAVGEHVSIDCHGDTF